MLARLLRALFAISLAVGACSSAPEADSDSDVDSDTEPALPDCESGARPGAVGATDGETTADGPGPIVFNVRTPADYDPTVAHPLLVVYAPAGGDEDLTEQFTGLTDDATGAGYVIAYADHRSPQSWEVIDRLGLIPGLVADKWCIDENRVFLTGHSDGGTIATALTFTEMTPRPTAIAPSAAGINTTFLAGATCPEPFPVMVLHSRNDSLFSVNDGFGRAAAEWWAACNGCNATPEARDADGCEEYGSCGDGVRVRYCEGSGTHGQWPTKNEAMVRFFDDAP